MRLAKLIADRGLCSRRQADRHVRAGLVTVNGSVESNPASLPPADALVTVDGRPLAAAGHKRSRLWLVHKLPKELCTHNDPKDRATVMARLAAMGVGGGGHLISVGRLDYMTEGLLLVTNDGQLARTMELPSTGLQREYHARVRGPVRLPVLDHMRHGLRVGQQRYKPVDVSWIGEAGVGGDGGHWLKVVLSEGKYREVRNILGHVGLYVERLVRTRFGPYKLTGLPKGAAKEVKPPNPATLPAAPPLSKLASRGRGRRRRGRSSGGPVDWEKQIV